MNRLVRSLARLTLAVLVLLLVPLADLPGSRASAQGFTGGVFVAVGNLGGPTGEELVTGPGPGGGPHVKAFDVLDQPVAVSFFAYPANFTGGVRVAVCDIDGDGFGDIVTGAGPGGGPHVKVFKVTSGTPNANFVAPTEIRSFLAYDASFLGGVFVACGDVNGDGTPDIITGAGPGGGPHVRVFDGNTGAEIASFMPYAPNFTGGVRVAAGVIDNSSKAVIVTAPGAGGGPHVRVFDVTGGTGTERFGFFAYDPAFTGGVFVGVGLNSDTGNRKIVTGAGAGGGPEVRVFDVNAAGTGVTLFSNFFAYAPGFPGGVTVAGATGGVVTGPGAGGGPDVRTFFDDGDLLSNFLAY